MLNLVKLNLAIEFGGPEQFRQTPRIVAQLQAAGRDNGGADCHSAYGIQASH